jgi:hypothetical protein
VAVVRTGSDFNGFGVSVVDLATCLPLSLSRTGIGSHLGPWATWPCHSGAGGAPTPGDAFTGGSLSSAPPPSSARAFSAEDGRLDDHPRRFDHNRFLQPGHGRVLLIHYLLGCLVWEVIGAAGLDQRYGSDRRWHTGAARYGLSHRRHACTTLPVSLLAASVRAGPRVRALVEERETGTAANAMLAVGEAAAVGAPRQASRQFVG